MNLSKSLRLLLHLCLVYATNRRCHRCGACFAAAGVKTVNKLLIQTAEIAYYHITPSVLDDALWFCILQKLTTLLLSRVLQTVALLHISAVCLEGTKTVRHTLNTLCSDAFGCCFSIWLLLL
jgi:hypothetical protein